MTTYEKYRVILQFFQVLATFSIPLVAVILREVLKLRRERLKRKVK